MAGHPESLDRVKKGFRDGQITKDEFKKALRIYQKSVDEMKSDARDIGEFSLRWPPYAPYHYPL